MKLLHVADTHLGFSTYRKVSEEGINQREQDIYHAFQQVIDYAIETKPDIVIHSGDLFDSVRPNNRAITIAFKELLRLSKKHIPCVIISGNHEQPKLEETGHIFSAFDHLDEVYAIYHESYERKYFTLNKKKLCIHALPQTRTIEQFDTQLRSLEPDRNCDYNILMAHGSVQGVKEFSMNEFNELFIPEHLLHTNVFDYIALGHYHTFKKISDRAYYAGATEALTFADANQRKGLIEVYLSEKTTNIHFIPLETREIIDTKPINCSDLHLDDIMKKIIDTIKTIGPTNKIFRIHLHNILIQQYRSLDFHEIRKICAPALHYEIKPDFIDTLTHPSRDIVKIEELHKEFQQYMDAQNLKEKSELIELGRYYLEKITSEKEAE